MSNQNSNSQRNGAANNNKMLIDATHPEETRVVVLRSGRVEEFDFESAARKLLRGNIYLAKVTRVEPSLQAAFVDYGGNRHGFLAFNEIHPDYYQIPIADRRALIEAETAAEAEEEEAADRAAEAAARRGGRGRQGNRNAGRGGEHADDIVEDNALDVTDMLPPERAERDEHGEPAASASTFDQPRTEDEGARTLAERAEPVEAVRSEPVEPREFAPTASENEPHHTHSTDERSHHDEPADASNGEGRVETVEAVSGGEAEQIETVSVNEDVLEEVPVRPRRRLRSYKIQEVIKRRQVLLVQVVKEERGTKGAALTTYLSLAGRYTVLMPNTARGGGISRKISNPQDRKRLKAIAAELDVPEGMGLIIRTAGAARTKQEIKRDYEYLLRLWESVRELALGSNAPALVYEEGNLIKRSIRDLYGKEVEEIVVAGADAYREAHDFMRMLMPSHAKNVHYYEDPEPLFTRFGMERQLNAMFSPYVHLRSGGYLVINQTEALVAIDINSGKSTREFSIEETALSTNLEAADEIARQLKLRDLAGLIVIDFIDMEEKRNNRAVERRLKDALRHDRARIQLGRISHFGLLEMSRQRMRTGVLEGSTTQCPHCQGTGIIRSTESVALAVLRGLEDALMNGAPASLTATTTATVALYILNHKRSFIVEMESRYGITVQIQASEKVQGANFTIERQARREEIQRRPERTAVNMDWGFEDEEQEAAEPADELESAGAPQSESEGGSGGEGRRRRRRRRGRRGDREIGGEPRQSHGQDRGYDDEGDGRSARASDEDRGAAAEARNGEDFDERGSHDRNVVEVVDTDHEADDRDGDEDDGQQAGASDRPSDGSPGGERRRRRRRGRRGGRRNLERDRATQGEGGGDSDQPRDQVYASPGEVEGAESRVMADAPYDNDAPRFDAMSEPTHREPVPVPHVEREPERVTAEAIAEPAQASAMNGSGSAGSANGHAQVAAAEPVEATPPAPAMPPPPTPRSAPVSSEPVLERVVVGPDANSAVAAAEEAARPARRGWWQRR